MTIPGLALTFLKKKIIICLASHRLDRLTSGILILGKSSFAASKLSQKLRDKELTKEYVALVNGVFP